MTKHSALERAFLTLNAEQRLAVETLDGPVLVVAGPGTGKTQLLSLRVAKLLQERDISPENICCLTFTDAGAEAMKKRLTGFIQRDAYGVHISTFHSFASQLRNRYPEYFERSAFDRQITPLQSKQLINALLGALEVKDPLYQKPQLGAHGAVYNSLGEVESSIDSIKRSGLEPAELRAIIAQNRASFAFVREHSQLLPLLNAGIPGARAAKLDYLQEVLAELERLLAAAPPELRTPVLDLPGIYVPYLCMLAQRFKTTELFVDKGASLSTEGFQNLKERFFENKPLAPKDARINERMASALGIYETYCAQLKEQGRFDFQDIINDAIKAIAHSPELKAQLTEQYRYLLIDEFQDTNGSQMRLASLLTEGLERPNILAVGDDDQAIMRFQGASVAYLNQFEQHYAGTKRIVLKSNYRSLAPLVELGKQVAGQIVGRSAASATEKNLSAARGEAAPCSDAPTDTPPTETAPTDTPPTETAPTKPALPAFSTTIYQSPEIEYYEVARELRALMDTGFIAAAKEPSEAVAVIAAKHAQLRLLTPYLEHFEVPFSYRINSAVAEIASLQTLLAVLRFVLHASRGDAQRADVSLPQIVSAPEFVEHYGIKPQDYLAFALEARGKNWFEQLGACSHAGFAALHAWLAQLSHKAACLSARALLYEAAQPMISYYNSKNERVFVSLEFNYGLKALLDFCVTERPLSAQASTERALLRLADVGAVLDAADTFGVQIAVNIPHNRKDAITLTTAHSSKGLEFDLVYLLDADDGSWHNSGKASSVLTSNLLLGNTKDEDDHRRLLYVALTRAKDELRLVQAKPHILRELVGEIEAVECELKADELAAVSAQSWQDRYLPNLVTMQELAAQALKQRKLSASLLNAFVAYPGTDLSGESFLQQQILRLPQEPSIAAEFGTIVHAFFEDYLNDVINAQGRTCSELAELVELARTRIRELDFEQERIQQQLQFFDLIVEHFLPELDAMLTQQGGSPALAEQWLEAWVDDVPLAGKVDLMLLDTAAQHIKVYDYKTGAFDKSKLDENYLRQLRFYRLLIESAPQYEGWRVLGGADLHVVPQRDLGFTLPQPLFFEVSNEELAHLRALVVAVWRRLQEGRFDTSAFLTSTQYAELCAASVYKSNSGEHKKGSPKPPGKAELQAAYEQWLIACEADKEGRTFCPNG